MNDQKTTSITLLLPAGRLPLSVMQKVSELTGKYRFEMYLSTLQNLRLINVPSGAEQAIKDELAPLGIKFKGKMQFPIPRVCVGKQHCNLGVIDTEELSHSIISRFADRSETKPKFKIAVSACTLCCSGAKTSDIGIIATRNGFDLYTGGKGGPAPKTGRRIKRDLSESELLDTIAALVDFHDRKTGKKQRMHKLLSDNEFPFAEI